MFKKIVPVVLLLAASIVLSGASAQADYKPPFTWSFIDVTLRCTPTGGSARSSFKFVMLSNTFSYCSGDVNLDGLYQMSQRDIELFAKFGCTEGSASILNGIARGPYSTQGYAETAKQNTIKTDRSNGFIVRDMESSIVMYSGRCR